MAQTGLLELQKGIMAFLAQLSSVQALIGAPARIYDVPPPDATYPFILAGEVTSLPWNTNNLTGEDVTLSIQAYSNKNRGSLDIKRIGDVIRAALHHQTPPLAAGKIILCQYMGHKEEVSDGVTWLGTTTFNILLET